MKKVYPLHCLLQPTVRTARDKEGAFTYLLDHIPLGPRKEQNRVRRDHYWRRSFEFCRLVLLRRFSLEVRLFEQAGDM